MKRFLSVLKISKFLVFFLKTSKRILEKKDLKKDPYPYLVEYSPDVHVLKKEIKVLDIYKTDKKCFINYKN